MKLNNHHILVTGASSGIGREASRLFACLGAKVALTARDIGRLEMVLHSLEGDGHCAYPFDLNQTDDIPGFLKAIPGSLTGIFHCAGHESIRPIGIVKQKHIDEIFCLNVYSALMLAKGFAGVQAHPEIQKSLVLMSSVASHRGQQGMSLYSASKAAIDGAVRALACEFAPKNIRVNSIVAGAVKTEMHERITSSMSSESMAEYEQKHLLGFGEPIDIAHAAAFLLSSWSRWVTGTGLVIDGGFECK